ncbi:MAG TPA: hypothetical protein VHW23_16820 [Kofleriaceae bacterium]|jgi:hypothetical protein|nr:hypothetical protein [Kofleriaceae bacterium]
MPAPLPTLSLDELAAVTGGRHNHAHRRPAPSDATPALPAVSPEPPVTANPGAGVDLGVGRTARSFRPGSPY